MESEDAQPRALSHNSCMSKRNAVTRCTPEDQHVLDDDDLKRDFLESVVQVTPHNCAACLTKFEVTREEKLPCSQNIFHSSFFCIIQ